MVSHQKAIFLLIPRSLLRGVFISLASGAHCRIDVYEKPTGKLAWLLGFKTFRELLLLGLLNQRRWWTVTRARLCAQHIIRERLGECGLAEHS